MRSNRTSYYSLNNIRRNSALLFLLILLGSSNLYAQRLEAHFSKDFANNTLANRSWGGGASFIIDEWVKRVDFQINYDYSQYNSGKVVFGSQSQYTRHKIGIAALYIIPFKNPHFLFRIGGEIAYNNVKQVNSLKSDTLYYIETHRGNMLSLGPVAGFQAKIGQKDFFRVGINILPTYLIPLHYKVDHKEIEPIFKKGFFDLQLQIGIEFRLGGAVSNNQPLRQ